AYVAPPPIYRGGAAEFLVEFYVARLDSQPVGYVARDGTRPATVAPPAAVPTAGRYRVVSERIKR
ncbi:hypothetical protein ACLOJK_040876, partial [Asimina triloba]